VDERGKIRKRYRYADMMTPYEKLKSLSNAESFLKPGVSFDRLDEIARRCSDNEAARRLNQAKAQLFNSSTNLDNAPPESTPIAPLAQAHV